MRDIIWTIIVVWLIYKVVDIFKNSASKRSPSGSNTYSSQQYTQHNTSASHSEKDIKDAVKKHLNTEGEYVDFEEVK